MEQTLSNHRALTNVADPYALWPGAKVWMMSLLALVLRLPPVGTLLAVCFSEVP